MSASPAVGSSAPRASAAAEHLSNSTTCPPRPSDHPQNVQLKRRSWYKGAPSLRDCHQATHMHHGSDGLSTVSCMSAIALPDLWRVSCDDRATAVRHARVAFVLFLFLPEDFSDMHAETFSQATWLPSTSLRSSRRAPEEVLLAVLGAHSSLPRTEITRKRNPKENSAALLLTILLQIGS